MYRTSLLRASRRRSLAATIASDARAHHAFATEFDANLDRRGQRRGHARLVAEPAHPLRRRDEDAGRLDARAGRCCRPATCRPIGARTGPSRRSKSATRSRPRATSGATARRSCTRPASTSAPGPRKAASSAAARTPAPSTQIDGRSERRLHRDRPTTTTSTSRATGTTATSSKSPSTTSSRSRCR